MQDWRLDRVLASFDAHFSKRRKPDWHTDCLMKWRVKCGDRISYIGYLVSRLKRLGECRGWSESLLNISKRTYLYEEIRLLYFSTIVGTHIAQMSHYRDHCRPEWVKSGTCFLQPKISSPRILDLLDNTLRRDIEKKKKLLLKWNFFCKNIFSY